MYAYGTALTPDRRPVETARRGITAVANYMFDRGLFLVQYKGISEEDRKVLIEHRKQCGWYAGGMPVAPGVITMQEAVQLWEVHRSANDFMHADQL